MMMMRIFENPLLIAGDGGHLDKALVEGGFVNISLCRRLGYRSFTYRPVRRRLLPVVASAVAPLVGARAAPATGRTVRAVVVVGRGAARRGGGALLRDCSSRGEAGEGQGDDGEELHLE